MLMPGATMSISLFCVAEWRYFPAEVDCSDLNGFAVSTRISEFIGRVAVVPFIACRTDNRNAIVDCSLHRIVEFSHIPESEGLLQQSLPPEKGSNEYHA